MAKMLEKNEKHAFSLKAEIKKFEDSPRRDLNIIAMYLDERKPDFRTKDQYQVGLKKYFRPAKDLIPFDDDQILNAVKKAKEFVPGWTLHTLIKLLIK